MRKGEIPHIKEGKGEEHLVVKAKDGEGDAEWERWTVNGRRNDGATCLSKL